MYSKHSAASYKFEINMPQPETSCSSVGDCHELPRPWLLVGLRLRGGGRVDGTTCFTLFELPQKHPLLVAIVYDPGRLPVTQQNRTSLFCTFNTN